jgi:hypothetical protein
MDAGFAGDGMKQKLIAALWIVGYSFLGLWTCFLIWLVIDTGRITLSLFLRIALGAFVLWQVFTRVKDKWKSSASRN